MVCAIVARITLDGGLPRTGAVGYDSGIELRSLLKIEILPSGDDPQMFKP
jgi:hypothetical protein